MLTILIPTYQEKENITKIAKELFIILKHIEYKILFVDDNSNDDSEEEFKDLKKTSKNVDYIIRKDAERDLTKSILLGILKVETKYTCVTDCDLQHDIKKIPIMLEKIENNNYDLVIGSRFINPQSKIELSFGRKLNSKIGILLCKLIGIEKIQDPLSGFFICKTSILKSINSDIKTKGYKILLTLLYLLKNKINVIEMQTNFFTRNSGKSKLNIKIKMIFLKQILNLFLLRLKSKINFY